MSPASLDIRPGQKVLHTELGEGVILGKEQSGFVTVFFRVAGERQVPPESLQHTLDRFDQIISSISSATPDTIEKL